MECAMSTVHPGGGLKVTLVVTGCGGEHVTDDRVTGI